MRLRLALLLLAALTSTESSPGSQPALAEAAVTLEPVQLDASDPARLRVGRLRYIAGWTMRSTDPAFGGFSSLSVRDTSVTLLSDGGVLARFRLVNGRALEPRLSLLPGLGDVPKSKRDSESLAIDPATGAAWVGFEHGNLIRRYTADFAAEAATASPPAMAHWPANGGPEAMVRLRDGGFLVFSERGGSTPSEQEALLFAGDPTLPATPPPTRFRYRPPDGFVPTDAAQLPDERVLLLNRRFSLLAGIAAALTVIDPHAIAEGGVLSGAEIARLAPPLTVDNMEGLSITQDRGRTIVWLASDDNFLAFQRSLLLKFELLPR